jgi:hypothetical protein
MDWKQAILNFCRRADQLGGFATGAMIESGVCTYPAWRRITRTLKACGVLEGNRQRVHWAGGWNTERLARALNDQALNLSDPGQPAPEIRR